MNKISWTVLIVAFFSAFFLSFNCYPQNYTCPEHGTLDIDEVVTFTYLTEDYHLCERCVLKFLQNNLKEIKRFIIINKARLG